MPTQALHGLLLLSVLWNPSRRAMDSWISFRALTRRSYSWSSRSAVLEDERVERPLALVGLHRQVLVSAGHGDAILKPPVPQYTEHNDGYYESLLLLVLPILSSYGEKVAPFS
jgi:hypothetical protein